MLTYAIARDLLNSPQSQPGNSLAATIRVRDEKWVRTFKDTYSYPLRKGEQGQVQE